MPQLGPAPQKPPRSLPGRVLRVELRCRTVVHPSQSCATAQASAHESWGWRKLCARKQAPAAGPGRRVLSHRVKGASVRGGTVTQRAPHAGRPPRSPCCCTTTPGAEGLGALGHLRSAEGWVVRLTPVFCAAGLRAPPLGEVCAPHLLLRA